MTLEEKIFRGNQNMGWGLTKQSEMDWKIESTILIPINWNSDNGERNIDENKEE